MFNPITRTHVVYVVYVLEYTSTVPNRNRTIRSKSVPPNKLNLPLDL